MKLSGILALLILCVIVKGTFLSAVVQPLILGFGAVLGTISLNDVDLQSIEWKSWLPFITKLEKRESTSGEVTIRDEDTDETIEEIFERQERE